MNSYLSDKPIYSNPTSARRFTTKSSARPGYTLWLNANNEVLSIQPDGSEQWRAAGTDGGYEQSLVSGTRAIWDYEGMTTPTMYDCIVA